MQAGTSSRFCGRPRAPRPRPPPRRPSESRPRFPYIEATNGRINFKYGLEKSVFSFTDADFTLWSPAENQWSMRLEARPVRTDMPVTDTGTVKAEATMQRAALLRDAPMKATVTWERVQLGNLTRLIYGEDAAGAAPWRPARNSAEPPARSISPPPPSCATSAALTSPAAMPPTSTPPARRTERQRQPPPEHRVPPAPGRRSALRAGNAARPSFSPLRPGDLRREPRRQRPAQSGAPRQARPARRPHRQGHHLGFVPCQPPHRCAFHLDRQPGGQ